MEYGFLAILPPIVAIVLAIWTRQVYVSLLLGIFMGWLVIAGWNPVGGFMLTLDGFVSVFVSAGNTKTIMFSALMGALIYFMQASGGVKGFIARVERFLTGRAHENETQQQKTVQYMGWLTGMIVFVETSISVLTVGTLFRPLFDKLKISREKLAYIADSTSAPTSVLLPFNAWGAFIMGLLLTQGIERPFHVLISSIGYNFYPIFAIILVFLVIRFGWNIGPMKKAEERVQTTGELLNPGSTPMMATELTETEVKEHVKPRMRNMLLPLAVMILMMPVTLILTGWKAGTAGIPDASFADKVFHAIGEGSGSTAVLVAITVALIVSYILYSVQRIFKGKELVDGTLTGVKGMMPLALLMMFAFAINDVCVALHTGEYVASVASSWLSPALVPAIVFLISAFIAFATGTSWGTFAIMIGIAVPMAVTMDAHLLLTVAAVLGGGVFGDHCSPISDTTILSSMAAASDHMDHVNTQLPYGLISGVAALACYLVFGFVMS